MATTTAEIWSSFGRAVAVSCSLLFAAVPVSANLAAAGQKELVDADSAAREGDAAYEAGYFKDAEDQYRKAYELRTRVLGPDKPETLDVLNKLGLCAGEQGRYREAESIFQRAYDGRTRTLGAGDAATLDSLDNLAVAIQSEGRFSESERMLRDAYDKAKQALGTEHRTTLTILGNLAAAIESQGRYQEAEALERDLYDRRSRVLGREAPPTLATLNNLAVAVEAQGRYAEAERILHNVYDISVRVLGPNHPRTLRTLSNLVAVLLDQGRYGEAEKICRDLTRAISAMLGEDHPDVLVALSHVSDIEFAKGDFASAEAVSRRVYDARRKQLGANNADTLAAQEMLALAISAQGRTPEAETLMRQAYDGRAASLGSEHPETLRTWLKVALIVGQAGRVEEADGIIRRVAASELKVLGRGHPATVNAFYALANALLAERAYAEAASAYKSVCNLYGGFERWMSGSRSEPNTKAQARIVDCYRGLASALRGGASKQVGIISPYAKGVIQGGGLLTNTGDIALGLSQSRILDPAAEAFEASQRSVQSAAGEAVARNSAKAVAAKFGEGQAARDYETAAAERDSLETKFADSVLDRSPDGAIRRDNIAALVQEQETRLGRLQSELEQKAPSYWEYRFPKPLSVSELQNSSRPELLHGDEALVFWMYAPGDAHGLVYAVSKEQFGWAPLGLTGTELQTRIQRLRQEIDPGSYQLRSRGAVGAVVPTDLGFDVQSAHALYVALLGDPEIQRVIADKHTLIIVPSGPLTALPPSLLVVSARPGIERASSAAALRATRWLINDYAIGVLPDVSSLRTFRNRAANLGRADLPLLELANPEFAGSGPSPTTSYSGGILASDAESDGWSKQEVIESLRPLPGTLHEARLLREYLHAPENSLLLGASATKTELDRQQSDGRLSRVNVLGFATHALVTGDFVGLTEPALVLARPPKGSDPRRDDGLLRASDAAAFSLNADWVLLSACNTASPDEPAARGVSGLARAFFYAGARSILVSHWRVDDDAAARLVTETLRLQHGGAAHISPTVQYRAASGPITKAEALRLAMLELIGDQTQDPQSSAPVQISRSFARPSVWAPFVLIGEVRQVEH